MSEKGKPAYKLTYEDAVEVWLLRWDGWLQHRIASHFDVNQGRVNEVLKGKRHPAAEFEARLRRGEAA